MTGDQEPESRADGTPSWDEYLDDLAAQETATREQTSAIASGAAQRRLLTHLGGDA